MYVELKNINKTFNDYKASNNVNFAIEKGKLVALLGPSGSGKTTILRMIAGLENPDSGDILIDGKRVNDVEASKRGIGFVFQSYALFKYMTIYDNIAFGLQIQKKSKSEIKKRVMELIKLIGLEGLEKRYPNELSGGQRQRVAFARALAPNPSILLLDEPFSAIDAKVRKELRSWLKEMIKKVGITSIFVTHDQYEAIEVSDEIIVTNKGSIEQIGSPLELYKNPRTSFVAKFIGESTELEDYEKYKGFEEIGPGKKAVIRPEFIKIIKDGEYSQYPCAVQRGTVKGISFMGDNLEITLEVFGKTLVAKRNIEEEPLNIGEEVDVLVYRLYIFGDDTAHIVENSHFENKESIYI